MRTFYHKHAHADKLPPDLPLLVFVHGLGGTISQFGPLLNSLVTVASCLAIDLPGCGGSEFSSRNPEAYTPESLAELIHCAIERFRDRDIDQKVILIGHSYGCVLAAHLASNNSPLSELCSSYTIAMVAICPLGRSLCQSELRDIKRMSWAPTPVLTAIRLWDRWGGINSASVTRMAGENADEETRKLQLRFNEQSQSDVWRMMLVGMALQQKKARHKGEASLLGQHIWAGVRKPLFLLAAKDDTVTSVEEAEKIQVWLKEVAETNPEEEDSADLNVKLHIFDSPAAHSLLFSPRTIRSLAGYIENFLASDAIDPRLSPGWQLQQLTTAKWDVKNLEKWSKVAPCSAPIAHIFRALKTMRQNDEHHCPKVFIQNYGGEKGVRAVVDISRDQPVYNKDDLEAAGIHYHKFPTISKIVPSVDEVSGFCALIDRLREEFGIDGKLAQRDLIQEELDPDNRVGPGTIGVHCHYGFNRTGFLICCYLIEKLGWTVEDAVAEFAKKREPGIKHDHFLDELHMRYEA